MTKLPEIGAEKYRQWIRDWEAARKAGQFVPDVTPVVLPGPTIFSIRTFLTKYARHDLVDILNERLGITVDATGWRLRPSLVFMLHGAILAADPAAPVSEIEESIRHALSIWEQSEADRARVLLGET